MPSGAHSSLITYIVGAFTGAVTAILAATVGHILAERRETKNREHAANTSRENRKQDFLGLLSGMRSEAERLVGQQYANVFPKRIRQLRRETPKIKRDLDPPGQREFDFAIESLCGLTDSQASETLPDGNHPGRKRVTEAIDAIVKSLG